MSETRLSTEAHDKPGLYEIRLKGHLDDRWAAWFGGLTITLEENGETRLTGPVVDQAALHGLLKKVRNLGLPLLSVIRLNPGQANMAEINPSIETYQYRSKKGEKTMTTQEKMNSINKTARMAGFLYLILAICGGFAEFFVRQGLIVPGDAVTTVNNIMASELLFRLGFVSELVGQTVFILLGLALYKVLKPVDKNQAVLMVIFVLVAVTITCINMLNQFAALLLLSGADYLTVFEADQLPALVLLFLNLHKAGYLIAQIFFGLWLLPLGYLVYKSGFFPRILGVLLMIACFGYLIDVFTFSLLPDVEVVISEFTFVGELLLLLWLLIKGVNVEQWEKRALESARI